MHSPAPRRHFRSPQGQTEQSCATRYRPWRSQRDRKSTRLNSSHLVISYAVFCLKKKKQASPTTDIDIPAGRTFILTLDDVYYSRLAVPASVTHRMTASFRSLCPDLGELARSSP